MTRPVIHTLTLACLLLLAGRATAADISGGTEADRERLQEISKQWIDAYVGGDLDGLMALMHEDAIVMAQGSPTVRGLDAVRAYFAPRIGSPGVTFTDDLQEIRISGDWAFVRGDFQLEVAPREEGGEPWRRNGRYFVLYEKTAGGDWKMLRDIDNDAPRDAP